jgi:hypothetical protein
MAIVDGQPLDNRTGLNMVKVRSRAAGDPTDDEAERVALQEGNQGRPLARILTHTIIGVVLPPDSKEDENVRRSFGKGTAV